MLIAAFATMFFLTAASLQAALSARTRRCAKPQEVQEPKGFRAFSGDYRSHPLGK
jgi:hypothetical protein